MNSKIIIISGDPNSINSEIIFKAWKEVSKLKPGITGWAQVNGRDELSISEKVQYDEEYLKRACMSFDIYIIWLTIIKVIKKDGVSH